MSLKFPSDNVIAVTIAAKQRDLTWMMVTHIHAALYHTNTSTIGALAREQLPGQVVFPIEWSLGPRGAVVSANDDMGNLLRYYACGLQGFLVRHPLPRTLGCLKKLVHCSHMQRRFVVQAFNLSQLARRGGIHSCE
jgi:hypothetical protein